MAVEDFLELLHVLLQGLLHVALHDGVYGGVYFESVAIEVIGRAIGLEVVFLAKDALNFLAELAPEVGSQAFVMHVVGPFSDFDGQGLQGVFFFFGEVAASVHLVEHHIAALQGLLVAFGAHGVIYPGVFQHANEHGGFFDLEGVGFFAKVVFGCSLDAIAFVQKVEFIEVHGDDLLLGVFALEAGGDDPLFEFLQGALPQIFGVFVCKKQLGQLLGNGTAPARAALLQDDGFEENPSKRFEIYAGVLVVACIFRSDEGMYQMWREVFVFDAHAVFDEVAPQHAAIGGIDLRGQFAARVFQLAGVGQVRKRQAHKEQDERKHACTKSIPKVFDDFPV